ncbi:acetyl-CoA carboxylase biotin carboxyl carrier protein [Mycoplasmatota bacterium WC44]
MDIKTIKSIMKEFCHSDIHKLSIELEGSKISLEKEDVKSVIETVVERPTAHQVIEAPTQLPVTETVVEETGFKVLAPLVGTFYGSPSPDDEAFVNIGDTVSKGQVLCIVEAMKVMNEIKAPTAGKIVSILVNNEDMVEFDQPIMIIE